MAKRNATFTSVWDGGIKVNSRCHASITKGEITDIGKNDFKGDDGELEILEEEYVILDSDPSKRYPAKHWDDADASDEAGMIYYR